MASWCLVLPPPVRAYVYRVAPRPRAGALTVADKIKCRTACLMYGSIFTNPKLARFPVFAPIDSVRETFGKPMDFAGRAGFVFIDMPPPLGVIDFSPEPNPPWRGNDWYPFPVAVELLDTKRITWADITHVLYATGSITPPQMMNVVGAIIVAARQANQLCFRG